MTALSYFIIFLVVCAAIAGVIFALKHEKNKEQEALSLQTQSLFLRIYNNVTGEQIASGYKIRFIDQPVSLENTSLEEGRIKLSLPQNASFYLFNQQEGYYTSIYKDAVQEGLLGDKDVQFYVLPWGNVSLTSNALSDSGFLTLEINKTGEFRPAIICTRHGTQIVSVQIPSLPKVDVPLRLEDKVDKCFDAHSLLASINITVLTFGSLDEDDFVRFTLVDEDLDPETLQPVMEREGKDLGMPDIIYEVRL